MYTVFECRSCGFVWDCEGTPRGDCPKCGSEGALTHQNGVDYCWQCGEPEGVCQCWGESEAEKPANTGLQSDGAKRSRIGWMGDINGLGCDPSTP